MVARLRIGAIFGGAGVRNTSYFWTDAVNVSDRGSRSGAAGKVQGEVGVFGRGAAKARSRDPRSELAENRSFRVCGRVWSNRRTSRAIHCTTAAGRGKGLIGTP